MLKVKGDIISFEAPQLKTRLDELTDQGRLLILVDLSQVDHMDSGGFGILMACFTRLKKLEGRLILCRPSGPVRLILKLTGLHHFFEIYESEDEALAAF